MRLYISGLFAVIFLVACSASAQQISISIQVDGGTRQVSVSAGSSVRDALTAAGIDLGDLDRTEPPAYSELSDGDTFRVIRVTEEFETEQIPVAYISRTLPNEGLPLGEQRLIQNGVNGLKEVHVRLVYEDGELVSRTEVDSVVVTQPVEEIIMIGAQSPFSSVAISGRLAFIAAGNAWVLEGRSGNRRPVALTGDLDGRIFAVSPDGKWLLFTRSVSIGLNINALWVANLDEGDQRLLDLHVGNVVQYAGWVPNAEYQVAFSSAKPNVNPPGWEANNDLQVLDFSPEGQVGKPRSVLSSRKDGLYAWWGTNFAWSPSGAQIAFARPDAVGSVARNADGLDVWSQVPAYETGSEWAWIPGLSWASEDSFYYVRYSVNPPTFSLVLANANGEEEEVVSDVGMFASPVTEPGGGQVAFLRAFTPSQSDISGYQLMVATPSGASTPLFPPEGAAGLEPQEVSWSPSAENGPSIAFVYEGNLWIVNVLTSEAQQLTGDGLVSALSWR